MDLPAEEPTQHQAEKRQIKGKIEFRDVSFRYGPTIPAVLENVSFLVPAGTRIGICGKLFPKSREISDTKNPQGVQAAAKALC